MLRLLPPICRDCGKSTKEAALGPYLDFYLCSACIARRERALLVDSDGRRGRRVASSGQDEEAPSGKRKTPAKPESKPKKPAKKKGTSRRPLKP